MGAWDNSISIAVITFNTHVVEHISLKNKRKLAQTEARIQAIQYTGGVALYTEALATAIDMFKNANKQIRAAQNKVVFLGNGYIEEYNTLDDCAMSFAEELQSKEIDAEIYAIGKQRQSAVISLLYDALGVGYYVSYN